MTSFFYCIHTDRSCVSECLHGQFQILFRIDRRKTPVRPWIIIIHDKSSFMHQCWIRYAVYETLNNQDILRSILGFLDPYCLEQMWDFKEKKERFKALSCIARTCQSFKDPALDILWSQLEGLDQVISCIRNRCNVRISFLRGDRILIHLPMCLGHQYLE